MKRLYIIGGTPRLGKTTLANRLAATLEGDIPIIHGDTINRALRELSEHWPDCSSNLWSSPNVFFNNIRERETLVTNETIDILNEMYKIENTIIIEGVYYPDLFDFSLLKWNISLSEIYLINTNNPENELKRLKSLRDRGDATFLQECDDDMILDWVNANKIRTERFTEIDRNNIDLVDYDSQGDYINAALDLLTIPLSHSLH